MIWGSELQLQHEQSGAPQRKMRRTVPRRKEARKVSSQFLIARISQNVSLYNRWQERVGGSKFMWHILEPVSLPLLQACKPLEDVSANVPSVQGMEFKQISLWTHIRTIDHFLS